MRATVDAAHSLEGVRGFEVPCICVLATIKSCVSLLPFSLQFCRCGPFNSRGHQLALGKTRFSVGSTTARICFSSHDTTLISTLHCDGSARPGTADTDGAPSVVCQEEERYWASEVGGRWCPKTVAILAQAVSLERCIAHACDAWSMVWRRSYQHRSNPTHGPLPTFKNSKCVWLSNRNYLLRNALEFGDTSTIARVGALVGQGRSTHVIHVSGANGRHNEVNIDGSFDRFRRMRSDDVCPRIPVVCVHLRSGAKSERCKVRSSRRASNPGPQSRVRPRREEIAEDLLSSLEFELTMLDSSDDELLGWVQSSTGQSPIHQHFQIFLPQWSSKRCGLTPRSKRVLSMVGFSGRHQHVPRLQLHHKPYGLRWSVSSPVRDPPFADPSGSDSDVPLVSRGRFAALSDDMTVLVERCPGAAEVPFPLARRTAPDN